MVGRALDVLCFGESLVDLLPDRRGRLRECGSFTVHSGGAPSNVAVGLARLGRPVGLCGVLGDDELGRLLERKLTAEGIRASFRFTQEAPTGCWFVALDQDGNRSFFSPSGAGSADKRLAREDAERAEIGAARFLHFGSSGHVRPEGQEALFVALARARAAGTLVSFDPNVRAHLWADPADLRALCLRALPSCDVVKLSDDESEAVLGEPDPRRAARRLGALGVQLACITLGAKGALALRGDDELWVEAPRVEVVDTTGAGDGFMAGLLSLLAAPRTPPIAEIPTERLLRALRFGCALGSRVCTKLGAVAGLPTRAALEAEGVGLP